MHSTKGFKKQCTYKYNDNIPTNITIYKIKKSDRCQNGVDKIE